MQKTEFSDRVSEMIALFEDSDVSRFPEVQEASPGVMQAACYLIVTNSVDPTEQALVKALRGFMSYSMDEATLASTEDQHFMDLVDERKFGPGLLDRLTWEVAQYVIRSHEERANHAIRLRERRGWADKDCGFYVFGADAV